MNFNIVVDPTAKRNLKLLRRQNPSLFSLLSKLIDSLELNPFAGKPLQGDKHHCYSLRSGDYRIIYEIYLTEKTIHIIRVGHRREVYR